MVNYKKEVIHFWDRLLFFVPNVCQFCWCRCVVCLPVANIRWPPSSWFWVLGYFQQVQLKAFTCYCSNLSAFCKFDSSTRLKILYLNLTGRFQFNLHWINNYVLGSKRKDINITDLCLNRSSFPRTTFTEFSELRTKSQSSMVIRDTTYLTIDIILDAVVKRNFHYYIRNGISSVWWMTIDIYPEAVMEIYTGNVFVSRRVMRLVAIPFFIFCNDSLNSLIHWIHEMHLEKTPLCSLCLSSLSDLRSCLKNWAD